MQTSIFLIDVHNASTTIQIGKVVSVNDATDLCIQIWGTSTSFIVSFEASLDGINFDTFEGYRIGDTTKTLITSATTKGLYEFDVTLVKAFRANLIAIANGNISVAANGVILND